MITLEFLRSFRFGGYAVFDFVVSFLGFYLLAPFLSRLFLKVRVEVPKWNWLFSDFTYWDSCAFGFGEITPMTREFFDLGGHYILKVFILGLLGFGLRGIRVIGNKKLKS